MKAFIILNALLKSKQVNGIRYMIFEILIVRILSIKLFMLEVANIITNV